MKRKNKDSFTDLEKKYHKMALDFYSGRVQGVPPDTAMADVLLFGSEDSKRERLKIFKDNNLRPQLVQSIKSLNEQLKEIDSI